ncbi:MAG: Mth938-like domain-containing protein [Alphaproteobacteria bacterium]|nr:Mth938-like domain-containing protein [Alphaproteobacteria bacterium]
MDITPYVPQHAHVINGYSTTGFMINGTLNEGSILIAEGECRAISFHEASALTSEDIENLLQSYQGHLEILLIGTGTKQASISKGMVELIARKFNCQLEVMTTGSACRTYNILMSEGRLVVAILLVDKAPV